VIEPSERLDADCQDQVQALAHEILKNGAAAMAAGAALAGQGAQRPEGEKGIRASRAATQPDTMPPHSTPIRTMRAPASAMGPQVSGGPPGSTLPAMAVRPEVQRPKGVRPLTGPAVATRPSRMEFNSLMSREEVLRALLQLLHDQFKQPSEVAAEFGEGYAAPEEDAKLLIAGQFEGRILTDQDFDVGFNLDQDMAVHRL
jgi:hypothetical protein